MQGIRPCATGDPATVTDPVATTTFSYDAHGNLTSVARPLVGTSSSATTTNAYDPARPGDLISTTDADGHVWHYGYDSAGNRVSQTDPVGNRTTTAYNEIGWPTSTVSARGNVSGADPGQYTTTLSYDDFGDATSVQDPLGRGSQTTYDADRNPTIQTAADGTSTQTGYDELGRPTSVTRADASTLRFAYDAAGNRTSVTDGLDHQTTFSYDPLGRLIGQVDALNRATSYSYDASGRQTATQDAAGRTTTQVYDAASQLTSVSYSDGQTHAVSYGYDQLGQRTQMTDQTGTSHWAYDSLGRLTTTTDASNRTLSYAYDLAGHPTKITYPAGLVAQTAPGQTINDPSVTRAYDPAGRLTSVTDWLGSSTAFSYDPNGNLTRQQYPNTTAATLTYDRADQLTQRTDTGPAGTILDLPYTRTALGQIASQRAGGTPQAPTATLGYDQRQQLTSVTVAGQVTTGYTHDIADRLTRIQDATTTTGLQYDDANELTRTFDAASGATRSTLSYDRVGERTLTQPADPGGQLATPAPTSYHYDQAGNLTAVQKTSTSLTDPSIDRSYAYNGDGLRADLLWDQTAGLPLILADQDALYITGPDGLPIEQLGLDATRRYYHHDQLGSTRATTDPTGNVTARYDYDPNGNPTNQPTEPVAFGYAGQYTDHTTGLLYMRARWYDPTTGQFITSDPIGQASGETNLYRYAAGDPANLVDPSGLDACLLGVCASQIATRYVGFVDGITALSPLGFSTADVRDSFNLNGGLDKCSSDYTIARTIGVATGVVESVVGTGGGLLAARSAATNGEKGLNWVWKTRPRAGADGGVSRIGIERAGDDAISQVHSVTADGKVVHQHQTHIGKYGGQRQFPDDWVQFPGVGSP